MQHRYDSWQIVTFAAGMNFYLIFLLLKGTNVSVCLYNFANKKSTLMSILILTTNIQIITTQYHYYEILYFNIITQTTKFQGTLLNR